MTKKTKNKTKEINYSLFLKKSQIDTLNSLDSLDKKTWLEIKANFIATYNHVRNLVDIGIKDGSIPLNRNQTKSNKSKEVFIKALKLAKLDEDYIYNNTKLICKDEVVEKLTSDNPKEILEAFGGYNVDTLEDFKEKIIGKKPNNNKKDKDEVEVEVELTSFQEAQLIAEKINAGRFNEAGLDVISKACLTAQSTTFEAQDLVNKTNLKDEQEPKVSTGKIKTNKKTNKKTGTNG